MSRKLRSRYKRKTQPSVTGSQLRQKHSEILEAGEVYTLTVAQAFPEHDYEAGEDCQCYECFLKYTDFPEHRSRDEIAAEIAANASIDDSTDQLRSDNEFLCNCRECSLPQPLVLQLKL